jgi:hypothetical protein
VFGLFGEDAVQRRAEQRRIDFTRPSAPMFSFPSVGTTFVIRTSMATLDALARSKDLE